MLKLKRIFKNKKINEITSYQIELALLNEKNRTKRSNGSNGKDKIGLNTLHHEYTMLRIIFNKAEAWGFISKNPMRLVEEPVFDEKVIVVPEYEEFSDIENKINSSEIRERCQFLLALYSGVREEEVCGVHIKDFNFEEKTVSIKRAIVQDEQTRKYIEDKTKSNKSIRIIPLPEKYFDVLKEYLNYRKTIVDYLKFKNNNYKEIDNLFLNKEGDFYRPNRLSRMWSRFAKENNINLTFHGLRHYYITNQMNYNDNLSPRDVQELAGHSNINTTYKYVHSSKKRIKENATNLFEGFTKESLYKNGDDVLAIPISHIATIILGDSRLCNINDLFITLSELTKNNIDFFNIKCTR